MPDSAPLPAAKLMPKVEELWVTTEPFPASRKVHAPGRLHPGISVGMREIDLDPSAGEPPVRAYDTSGPYSDPTIQIDINRGPPKLRKPWILARADVELYEGREVKPEDNGLRRGEASAVSPFDRGRRQVLRAKGGAAVTQLAYGGDKAPERNDQFGCQRHDHCLACATTAIGGAGAIPLPERSHSEMSENARQVGSCRGGPGRCRLWRALARAVARRSGSEVTSACELLGLDPLHVAHEGRLIAFVAPEDAERAIALLRRHAVTSASAMIGEVTGGSA